MPKALSTFVETAPFHLLFKPRRPKKASPEQGRQTGRLRPSISFFLITSLSFFSCSGLEFGLGGGSGTLNDPRPSGILLASGPLVGQSGRTVTGTAAVFNTTGSQFILRLEGLTLPSSDALAQIQLFGQLGLQNTFTLRSTSGSQNYTFTNTSLAITFSDVTLVSTATNQPIASANLHPSNPR
ncbi:MAG: hypothetical protein ACO3A2_11740 [Bdellovibrionia bacterium]